MSDDKTPGPATEDSGKCTRCGATLASADKAAGRPAEGTRDCGDLLCDECVAREVQEFEADEMEQHALPQEPDPEPYDGPKGDLIDWDSIDWDAVQALELQAQSHRPGPNHKLNNLEFQTRLLKRMEGPAPWKLVCRAEGIGDTQEAAYRAKGEEDYKNGVISLAVRYLRGHSCACAISGLNDTELLDKYTNEPVYQEEMVAKGADGSTVTAKGKPTYLPDAQMRALQHRMRCRNPEMFSEKRILEITGKDGGPVATVEVPLDEIKKRLWAAYGLDIEDDDEEEEEPGGEA